MEQEWNKSGKDLFKLRQLGVAVHVMAFSGQVMAYCWSWGRILNYISHMFSEIVQLAPAMSACEKCWLHSLTRWLGGGAGLLLPSEVVNIDQSFAREYLRRFN